MKIKASAQDWKDQLPYTLESNWLNEIKKDFAILIQTNNSIGFTDVISALKLYLELKLEISKSDLIWYVLADCKEREPTLIVSATLFSTRRLAY